MQNTSSIPTLADALQISFSPEYSDYQKLLSKNPDCSFLFKVEISLADLHAALPRSLEDLARFFLITDSDQPIFLMESKSNNHENGRYSFLGIHPSDHLVLNQGVIYRLENNHRKKITDSKTNPIEFLNELIASRKTISPDDFPGFASGIAGMFSFEFFAHYEPSIPVFHPFENHQMFNDFDLMIFDELYCMDHQSDLFMFLIRINHPLNQNEYETFRKKQIQKIVCVLDEYAKFQDCKNRSKENGFKLFRNLGGRFLSQPRPQKSKDQYMEMVKKAKVHIENGDIFQIVLSNPIQSHFEGHLFESYSRLKQKNPSPYLFYFQSDELEAAGSSPETLITLKDEILKTFPLAGTRKRGFNSFEDLKLEQDRLRDQKERAEHSMLVDLGRNDLGKVSEPGSVHVSQLMNVLRYSKVMHLGSEITSTIKKDLPKLDAFCSVFPAGTLSGAPKIRACQLIHDLEAKRRGLYGGAFGYLDDRGSMDFCIAIRLAYKNQGLLTIQSGAGIVYDSDPQNEYEECLAKASAVIETLLEVCPCSY
ncbi:anthranilate synthase component I family protein [Ileibacterium valens]|uniref:anthranilate synthase component I family protein n=1 Tax=Ileibacterium valens TaxID=1862668 RepID=UPI00272B7B58|nr:anthranilate synthase component I family protein [Ileibacterium valens]